MRFSVVVKVLSVKWDGLICSRYLGRLLCPPYHHRFKGSQIKVDDRRNLWTCSNGTPSQEIHSLISKIYVYEDNDWNDVLKLVDDSSDYALTGSMFVLSSHHLSVVLQPTAQQL
jgi:hypothetical protein